jgi:hypothetical protein
MPLLTILVVLIVAGIILWLITTNPNGPQDQEHLKHSSGDHYNYLAPESIWDPGFFERGSYIKKNLTNYPSQVI